MSRFFAMGLPIIPRPISPIFIIHFLLKIIAQIGVDRNYKKRTHALAWATFLVTITSAPRPHTGRARGHLPDGGGGLETYGVDDLHYPEDVLLGDGAAEPHAGQGQFAALHQYAGGDIALGVGELLADIGVSLGAGGSPGRRTPCPTYIRPGDLTAVWGR